ncbi:MnhB domain-containing protein [Senegalia massiliensis]|jgi:multicomponent Na+:H+ antiporter subunit B|uniref:MnhB domain-containing protein n=1 Tax=Senegalia massiliensis TaxID=1720316 RepID=UPI00102FB0A3|nr:MnhB domain-containing protein [Senegalia massiliensis]
MKKSEILTCICRILFPFILIYGFYVIINGHLSPGGGFQGGAILATAILITYIVEVPILEDIVILVKLEKYSFFIIILVAMTSIFTRGSFFTNFIPEHMSMGVKTIFLLLLNFLIGIKVSTGLITIFTTFMEEGE